MSGKTKFGDSLSKTALKLLLNKEISIEIAQAFDIALNEHDHLNKSTHAKIQVLYKQRFFSMNVFSLLSSLKEEKENEFALLLAVANMIKQVPHTVLLNDIDKIFPIVIQALSSSDQNLIMAGVKTILFLIQQSKQKVVDNLNTIVSHLLKSVLNMKSMVFKTLFLRSIGD
jgi:UTP-glucose-1-phosphate uridylyltransferase